MKRWKWIYILTLCFLLSFPAAVASAANYTVSSNDTLYTLSKLFNTSVDTLRQSNRLSGDKLVAGKKIFVPAHVHKVKSGDTMHSIAVRYGIPLTRLKKANKNKTSIVPKEKLIIPGVKPYKKADSVISYKEGEVDLLAKLIEAEAGGESLKAKIAVGATVINRVQSGDWASSLTGVIYQKFNTYYQFTPVKNGKINNSPSAASKRAAWLAMFGSDPGNGAIFYFSQDNTNDWLWSKPQTAHIGRMYFAK